MAFIIPMEAIQQPQKVLLILHPLSSLIRKKNRINFLTFYLYIFNFPDMMRPLQPELLIGGNHQSLCCFHHLNHTNHVNMATSSSDELHEVNSSMRRRRRNPRPESVSSSHCNGPGMLCLWNYDRCLTQSPVLVTDWVPETRVLYFGSAMKKWVEQAFSSFFVNFLEYLMIF